MARDDGGQTCLINAGDGGCPAAGRCRALTFGALDAGVLVVTEEEALPAEALVAAHHVDAGLLAAAVALRALIQVCKVKVAGSEHGMVARRGDGELGVTDLLHSKSVLLYICDPSARRNRDALGLQGMKAKRVKG